MWCKGLVWLASRNRAHARGDVFPAWGATSLAINAQVAGIVYLGVDEPTWTALMRWGKDLNRKLRRIR